MAEIPSGEIPVVWSWTGTAGPVVVVEAGTVDGGGVVFRAGCCAGRVVEVDDGEEE